MCNIHFSTGPGAYDPRQSDKKGNPLVSKDTRFKKLEKNEIPGPGAYEVFSF